MSYEDSDGNQIEDTTEVVNVDVFGDFIEEDEDVSDENNYENDEKEDEYISITELDDLNERDVLIVVRRGWSNDFCFVVEYFDGQMARGTQFLNGNRYMASSYNRFQQEFTLYNGPSVSAIENQYE